MTKKLQHGAGETLAEMLVSMLIISMGMLMLSGAITSAARLNARAQKIEVMTDKQSLTLLPSLHYSGVVKLHDDTLDPGHTAPPATLTEIHGSIDRRMDDTSIFLEIGDYDAGDYHEK